MNRLRKAIERMWKEQNETFILLSKRIKEKAPLVPTFILEVVLKMLNTIIKAIVCLVLLIFGFAMSFRSPTYEKNN